MGSNNILQEQSLLAIKNDFRRGEDEADIFSKHYPYYGSQTINYIMAAIEELVFDVMYVYPDKLNNNHLSFEEKQEIYEIVGNLYKNESFRKRLKEITKTKEKESVA